MKPEIFKPLINFFSNMDQTWDKIAAGYAFQCNGCEDNCCKSLFFHHTYIEKAYLLHGFHRLEKKMQTIILKKAQTYCTKTFSQPGTIKSHRIYCPVNKNGLCLLYRFRPMICRLHGLPHELNRPGFKTLKNPGCEAGSFESKPYIKFDRTLIYQEMAQIELLYRKTFNKKGKIKESIAQMLIPKQRRSTS
jgi:Fe-S-cluster containining protein